VTPGGRAGGDATTPAITAWLLAAMPSMSTWHPAVTTAQILATVRLPEFIVLHLLHELDVAGLADEAGDRWRRRE
jgi:hypothetical protein